ncbi:MAG: ABC transporter substrate-binding protein [Firmicutes bacterium]|jgi:glycine betaine/proline transport system permease protein/glycine betaine/proline transport system substrate-binding protein|nr:ABC transporter substrate-binding protein [Bacillota bacterium]
MKKIISIVLLFALALTGIGCSEGTETGDKEIVFANAGWESIMFHNAVAGVIAEEVFGYTWTEVPGTTAVMHEGILKGEIDVNMENWTDNIAPYEGDLAAGKFEELGINFDDNYQGIYVPRYVIEGDPERGIEASAPDLKYVWDLKDHAELFPDDEKPGMGRIYGAIPGWEIDEIMHKKYLHYNLDDNFEYFRPGSDPALQAAITSAYERGEPVAAYYWEPTWLMGKYDMVLLDDEPYDKDTFLDGKCMPPAVKVTITASNKFADDETNRGFMEFLGRYRTSSQLTSEALAYMQETGTEDYVEVARWFLGEHEELVDAWLDPADAQTLKNILGK